METSQIKPNVKRNLRSSHTGVVGPVKMSWTILSVVQIIVLFPTALNLNPPPIYEAGAECRPLF